MSTEPMQSTSSYILKLSHRTTPEQIVGLSIFLFVSAGAFALLLTHASSWSAPLWALHHLLLPLSIWTLWRRNSLRILKLELSAYLTILSLQVLWSLSLFFLHETLLALVALSLLWCAELLAILLFWKRDRFSGVLLAIPFLWIFYVMVLNMATCISNP